MAGTVSIGLQGEVSYLASGTRATWGAATGGVHQGSAPSLTAINAVRDVTLNLAASEADVSSRASLWKLVAVALQEGSVDLKIPWNPTDAGFIALLGAYVSRSGIAIAILDGPHGASGSQGFWADFTVLGFTREEPLDKEMMANVKIAPTASAVPPEWVKVP